MSRIFAHTAGLMLLLWVWILPVAAQDDVFDDLDDAIANTARAVQDASAAAADFIDALPDAPSAGLGRPVAARLVFQGARADQSGDGTGDGAQAQNCAGGSIVGELGCVAAAMENAGVGGGGTGTTGARSQLPTAARAEIMVRPLLQAENGGYRLTLAVGARRLDIGAEVPAATAAALRRDSQIAHLRLIGFSRMLTETEAAQLRETLIVQIPVVAPFAVLTTFRLAQPLMVTVALPGGGAQLRVAAQSGPAENGRWRWRQAPMPLTYGRPYVIEAQFETAPPENQITVLLTPEGAAPTGVVLTKITARLYRSGPIRLAPGQGAALPGPEVAPELAGLLTQLAGPWEAEHQHPDPARIKFGGPVQIDANGAVTLALEDFDRSYATQAVSLRMDAGALTLRLRGEWPEPPNPPAQASVAGNLELGAAAAQVFEVPANARTMVLTYAAATASATIDAAQGRDIEIRLGQTETGDLQGFWQSFDNAGQPRASGTALWRNKTPIIEEIFVVTDQFHQDEAGISYPYPFDAQGRNLGHNRRTLLVIGQNFPRGGADDRVVFDAQGNPIRYALRGDYRDVGSNGVLRHDFDWAFERRGSRPAAGQDAFLVTATLEPGVLPGETLLKMNGAAGVWTLGFGDALGELAFVREIREDEFEPTARVTPMERAFVRVRLAGRLPMETIGVRLGVDGQPVTLEMPDATAANPDAAPRDPNLITLTRVSGGDGNTYLSPAIALHHPVQAHRAPPPVAGQIGLPVQAGQVIQAMLANPDQIRATPALLRVPVISGPAEVNGLWTEALARAARCHDMTGIDFRRIAAQESDEISNRIVFDRNFSEWFSRRSLRVTFGDHAAMILLRDRFNQKMARILGEYRAIRADTDKTRNFIRLMSGQVFDRNLPINRIEIAAPDGSKLDFTAVNNADWVRRRWALTQDQFAAWQLAQTRAALDVFIGHMETSIAKGNAAGDCDAQELLQLTGFGFDAVARDLLPDLLRLRTEREPDRQYWEPDLAARGWVSSLGTLAAAVKAQEDYAALDNTMIALSIAAVSVGAGAILGEGVLSAVVTLGVDTADLAFTLATEIPEYLQDQSNVTFARGASPVIGTERLDMESAEAKTWYEAALGVLGSGVGAGFTAYRSAGLVSDALSARRGADVAARLRSGTAATNLSEAEKVDLLSFLSRAEAKRAAEGGADSLTDLERGSLAWLDEATAANRAGGAAETGDVARLASAEDVSAARPADVSPDVTPTDAGRAITPPRSGADDLDALDAELVEAGGTAGTRTPAADAPPAENTGISNRLENAGAADDAGTTARVQPETPRPDARAPDTDVPTNVRPETPGAETPRADAPTTRDPAEIADAEPVRAASEGLPRRTAAPPEVDARTQALRGSADRQVARAADTARDGGYAAEALRADEALETARLQDAIDGRVADARSAGVPEDVISRNLGDPRAAEIAPVAARAAALDALEAEIRAADGIGAADDLPPPGRMAGDGGAPPAGAADDFDRLDIGAPSTGAAPPVTPRPETGPALPRRADAAETVPTRPDPIPDLPEAPASLGPDIPLLTQNPPPARLPDITDGNLPPVSAYARPADGAAVGDDWVRMQDGTRVPPDMADDPLVQFMTSRTPNMSADDLNRTTDLVFGDTHRGDWDSVYDAIRRGEIGPERAAMVQALRREIDDLAGLESSYMNTLRRADNGPIATPEQVALWRNNPGLQQEVQDGVLDIIRRAAAPPNDNQTAQAFLAHLDAGNVRLRFDAESPFLGYAPKRVLPDGREIPIDEIAVNPFFRHDAITGGASRVRTLDDMAATFIHEFAHRMGHGEMRAWMEEFHFLRQMGREGAAKLDDASAFARIAGEDGPVSAVSALRENLRGTYGSLYDALRLERQLTIPEGGLTPIPMPDEVGRLGGLNLESMRGVEDQSIYRAAGDADAGGALDETMIQPGPGNATPGLDETVIQPGAAADTAPTPVAGFDNPADLVASRRQMLEAEEARVQGIVTAWQRGDYAQLAPEDLAETLQPVLDARQGMAHQEALESAVDQLRGLGASEAEIMDLVGGLGIAGPDNISRWLGPVGNAQRELLTRSGHFLQSAADGNALQGRMTRVLAGQPEPGDLIALRASIDDAAARGGNYFDDLARTGRYSTADGFQPAMTPDAIASLRGMVDEGALLDDVAEFADGFDNLAFAPPASPARATGPVADAGFAPPPTTPASDSAPWSVGDLDFNTLPNSPLTRAPAPASAPSPVVDNRLAELETAAARADAAARSDIANRLANDAVPTHRSDAFVNARAVVTRANAARTMVTAVANARGAGVPEDILETLVTGPDATFDDQLRAIAALETEALTRQGYTVLPPQATADFAQLADRVQRGAATPADLAHLRDLENAAASRGEDFYATLHLQGTITPGQPYAPVMSQEAARALADAARQTGQ
ncbi:hypothetical protein SAMN04488005_1976 [Yoonia tamlensis]|uniref:Uncharacterized protein n=1 Tax=Yoonia tamlensis TaxID=390270 RepID=A0A1I6GP24_9RHOB|nr:hypothetical protein [Yoonia tamlensis]SFR43973.1 hypothetical protein SAMN04488005_1976 [Yoonia tamlensis]